MASPLDWAAVTPGFKSALRPPKLPERPSDGAVAQAQRSYDGQDNGEGETVHVMFHRFPTVEMAEAAADELKRAGAYTNPQTTVQVYHDEKDRRILSWRAGAKRGRKQ